jgi:hypothetical protein
MRIWRYVQRRVRISLWGCDCRQCCACVYSSTTSWMSMRSIKGIGSPAWKEWVKIDFPRCLLSPESRSRIGVSIRLFICIMFSYTWCETVLWSPDFDRFSHIQLSAVQEVVFGMSSICVSVSICAFLEPIRLNKYYLSFAISNVFTILVHFWWIKPSDIQKEGNFTRRSINI